MEKLQQVQPTPTRENVSKFAQLANAITSVAISSAHKLATEQGRKWLLRTASVFAAMGCLSSCASGGLGVSIPTRNGDIQVWGAGDSNVPVYNNYNGGLQVAPGYSTSTSWVEMGRVPVDGYVTRASPRQVFYR